MVIAAICGVVLGAFAFLAGAGGNKAVNLLIIPLKVTGNACEPGVPEHPLVSMKKNDLPEPQPGEEWRSPRPRVKTRRDIKSEYWKYRTAVMVDGYGPCSLG